MGGTSIHAGNLSTRDTPILSPASLVDPISNTLPDQFSLWFVIHATATVSATGKIWLMASRYGGVAEVRSGVKAAFGLS